MMFDGSSGRPPRSEARRYVLGVVASSIEDDLHDKQGWIFGGMEDPADRRLAKKAALALIAQLCRRAKR